LRKRSSRRSRRRELVESAPGVYVTFGDAFLKSATTVRDVHQIDANELALGGTLGQGAFGVVVEAQWRNTTVAVKQMHVVAGASAMSELRREVLRMAALPLHKNVVRLYGVSQLRGELAVVLELCSGGALSAALYGDKARQWTERALVGVACDAAAGVAHLHRSGVVHRDIAARNVLLDAQMTAKVSDFGMARVGRDDQLEQTTVTDVGPIKWMAPEQMTRRAYSYASDVFAFGVLLFEIFAREAPWAGTGNLQVATLVVGGQHLTPPPTAPAAVQRWMTRCFVIDAQKRPTMAELESVLRNETGA
jgi:serine/threonine protein kinase